MDRVVEPQETKKPFYKQWWFWAITTPILALLIIGVGMSIRGKQQDRSQAEQQKKETQQSQPQGEMAHVLDPSLPSCPTSLTNLFNHEIFDLADVDFVVPLGRVDAGVHTIPTDHMYINHFGQKKIAIYAPTDVTLISMDDKMTYSIEGDQFLHDDYSIEFAACRGISFYLNHFSEITPKIKTAFENSRRQCDDQQISFGTNATTYYKACQSQFKLSIKSGELLGYVGTFVGGPKTTATGMDLGVYNLNGTAHDFANPERYTEYNKHSMCGIDLFTDNIKNLYYQKLGSLNQDQVTLVPRTGEPLCGTDMQDVKGTLNGNWFFGGLNQSGPTMTEYYLALIHDVADFSKGTISWKGQKGNMTSTFTPKHSGTIDREFSEIKPSEQVYCYNTSSYIKGKATPKILMQLIDETHLKIESQLGACTASEKFVNPLTYER